MLRHTFVHAPGIGLANERKLWDAGARSWSHFLDLVRSGRLPGERMAQLSLLVQQSHEALEARDLDFFARRLPSSEQWRLYEEFAESAAFLDIETTGLSPAFDQITVVGLLDRNGYRDFVRGRNLEELPEVAGDLPLLVTFNGAQFDLPFLQASFPGFRPQAHLDLRFPLKRIGYRGGLKSIERQVGISRPDEVAGLDGFEAVRLWHRHRQGDPEALETLRAYTREDVQNLRPLAQLVSERLRQQLAGDLDLRSVG